MKTGTLLSVFCALLLATTVQSQNVIPDGSFGTSGILSIPSYNELVSFQRPWAQSTGKILVPFSAGDEFGYQTQGVVVRSTTNGVIDSSFGTGGYRYVDFGHFPASIRGVAVQADDKILVLYRRFDRNGIFDSARLERWLPNGELDTSFNGGTGIVGIGGGAGAIRGKYVVVKPDGHIVVCYSRNSSVYYIQLNRNGSVDRSFGTNGSIVGNSAYNLNPVGLTALPDNRIVIANEYTQGGSSYNNLYFYTAAGQPDASAGNSGVVMVGEQITNPGNQVDLKVYQSKLYVYAEGNGQDVLLRYSLNGTTDASFGTGGKVYSGAANGTYITHELDIQPDGKVITLLTSTPIYKRYRRNGTLDTAFATGGTFTPPAQSQGANFRLVASRLFITSLSYDDFGAVVYLSAFKSAPAASSGKTSLVAASQVGLHTSISVYPNPVKDVLTVTGLPGNTQYRLLLTSQDGKTVIAAFTGNASYQMNTSALAKGIYYLRVVDGNLRSTVITINKQ